MVLFSRVFLAISFVFALAVLACTFLGDLFYLGNDLASAVLGLSIVVYFVPFYGLVQHPRTALLTRSNWIWSLVFGLVSVWAAFGMYYASGDGIVLLDDEESRKAVTNGLAAISFDAFEKREYLYYSAVTITTLGYGDVQPLGDFRIASAVQAVIGFITVPIAIAELISQLYRESNADN